MTDPVRASLHDEGGLLRVVFERPGGNVLTGEVLRALDATLAEYADAPRLRLVTLEGHGRHFSFGASVEEHQAAQAAEMLATFHGVIRRLAGYPVPTAAVVRGRCLGGAFELALACRFVFAARDAVFACPEIKLGVLPPVLAALGPSRLGQAWTDRLLLTGADLDAPTGAALGFVTELADEAEDSFARAEGWYSRHLKGLSAYALRQGVTALKLGAGAEEPTGAVLDAVERHYLDRLLPSHDGNEGIAAFLARRPAVWRHA